MGASSPGGTPEARASGLVGRDPDLQTALGLLGCASLVAVIGPPGIGKTALARAAVSERRDSAWADLSGLGPRAALARVGRAVGFKGPATEHDLQLHLRSWPGLLVLDGGDGCSALCARLAAGMVSGFGPARVLLTAHRALGLYGEVRWALGPLSLPPNHSATPGELMASGSGALMAGLVRSLNPELHLDARAIRLLAQLCGQLGGSPLAIRIAAPLVASLGPELVADRLRQRSRGQRQEGAGPLLAPLARALELSIRSLDGRQVEALACLAEFPAGIGIEHLAGILAPGSEAPEGLEATLLALEERSLIGLQPGPTGARYRVSGALTEFLRQDGRWVGARARAAQRRISWSLAMVSGAESSLLCGSSQLAWLERLEAEEDNLTTSLEAAIDAGDSGTAAQLGAELWRFWELRGRLAEGRAWLTRILALPRLDRALRWRLLDGLGMLAWRQGDHGAARDIYREALSGGPLPGSRDEARLLHHLGLVEAFANQPQEALGLLGLAEQGHLRAGELGQVAMVRSSTGLVLAALGRLEDAQAQLDEALGAEAVAQDSHAHAIALLHQGMVSALRGMSGEALSSLQRSGSALVALGDERSAAYAVMGLATVLQPRDPPTALMLATAATVALERIGSPVPEPWASRVATALASARATLGCDQAERAVQAGGGLSLGQALGIAEGGPGSRGSDAALGLVRVLGGFRVHWAGRPLRLTGQPAVLVKLLATSDGAMPVEAVTEHLWPGADPEAGRWRLRNVLARLRREVRGLVVRRGDQLDFGETVAVDARTFRSEAQRALRQLRAHDPLALASGRSALESYAGPLLPGDPYEEWADGPRQHLAALRVQLLDGLARWARGHGDPGAAESYLREGIAEDPWDERRPMDLAELLRSSGRPLAALNVVQRAVATARASGLRPSSTLLVMERELRAAAPTGRDQGARDPDQGWRSRSPAQVVSG